MHLTTKMYQQKSKKGVDPEVADIPSFLREMFPRECKAIVDVYCDPPFPAWEELASAKDLPVKYFFAMGCHPHNAKEYTDKIEQAILRAMEDPYVSQRW